MRVLAAALAASLTLTARAADFPVDFDGTGKSAVTAVPAAPAVPDVRSATPAAAGGAAPGDWDGYVRYIEAAAGAVDAGRNEVHLFIDGAAHPALDAALDAARRSVSVEIFQLQGDDLGRDFTSRLAAAAGRGARVRLLLDGYGTNASDPQVAALLAALRKAGGEVVVRPPPLGDGHLDHRKLYVFDGGLAFAGGMNVGDLYEAAQWHDQLCSLSGPAAARLEGGFLARWTAAGGRLAPGEAAPGPDAAGGARTFLVAHEGGKDRAILLAYLRAIDTAQRSVRVADPYFTDPEVAAALERAARRGAAVQVVLPAVNNQPLVQDASRALYPDLLAAGVEVWEYQGRMAHEKVAVIDGLWATFGSSNLDARSLLDNDELNVVTLDPALAADIGRRLFDADLAKSVRVTRHSPDLAERFGRLVSGWLSYQGP